MNIDSKSTTDQSSIWSNQIVRFALLVPIVVGARGFLTAIMIDGAYELHSFLFDTIAALVIMLILQAFDWLLTKSLTKLFGEPSKKKLRLVQAVRMLVVVLVFGTFLLAAVQMHPPKIGCRKTPAEFDIEFSEHRVETADGLELAVWSMPAETPGRPVVVVTHGLGANKQNFMFISELFHHFNYNVVAFDFRGHGDSDGHTCTLGVKEAEDVKAVFEFASKTFPDHPIYAWSTSLGAAATLRAAAEDQIFDKLVIDATFSSVKNVALETKYCYLGPLAKPAWHISRLWYFVFVGADIESFAPELDIAKIKKPMFLIHGMADPVIPSTESERLKVAASEGTELWLVEGAGHSSSFHHEDYFPRVIEFFDAESSSVDPDTAEE